MLRNVCVTRQIVMFVGVILLGALQNMHAIGQVTEVADGVYAGQGSSKDGKTVYFGMERVDAQGLKKWELYKRHVKFLASNAGVLVMMTSHCSPDRRLPFDPAMQEETGFTQDEYTKFLDRLYEKGFSNPDKREGIKAVSTGISGFTLMDDGTYWVAYISKKPVTGKFVVPDLFEIIPLKKYQEVYGDLIMTMRVSDKVDTPFYENRGISRNPLSFMDGGYTGVSMQLHGFSAAVSVKCFKEKKYMMLNPVPFMGDLLRTEMKSAGVFTSPDLVHVEEKEGGKIYKVAKEGVDLKLYQGKSLPEDQTQALLPRTFLDSLRIEKFLSENTYLVNIDVLKGFYP